MKRTEYRINPFGGAYRVVVVDGLTIPLWSFIGPLHVLIVGMAPFGDGEGVEDGYDLRRCDGYDADQRDTER